MSGVMRDLSVLTGTKQIVETCFPDSASKMRFEAVGDKLTWEVNGAEPRTVTLGRFQALQA